jgi:hypothetical protein
MSVF